MKLLEIIEALRKKRVKRIAYGVLIFLVVVDFFIIPRHEIHFIGDKIRGFWSFFGFISCVVIIVASKWLGKYGLMKDEDYYAE